MARTKKIEQTEPKQEVEITLEDSQELETVAFPENPQALAAAKLVYNNLGLLDSVDYVFNDNGTIDWRKMIEPEFLFVNEGSFPEGTDLSALDKAELQDSELILGLQGIKHLSLLRGYSDLSYEVLQASLECAAVKCRIVWFPNYETNMVPVVFESVADAHIDNTTDFGRQFLLTVAENRAFVRCVRNFLRINIVGKDELGKQFKKKNSGTVENTSDDDGLVKDKQLAFMKSLMDQLDLSFEKVKKVMITKGCKEAVEWTTPEKLKSTEAYNIISLMKKKVDDKKKAE